MKRICVFCGSAPGRRPEYADSARQLGRLLASRGIELVYGGGSVGLMGIVSDAVLEAGGHVIGVIPRRLVEKEVAALGVPDLRVVESMHQRKALMAELSDAFIALPGGLGTFEELFEVLTWSQLGYHGKPVGLLDAGGYFGPLIAMLDHARDEGFVRAVHRQLALVEREPAAMLDRLAAWAPPPGDRWIAPGEA